MTQRNLEALPFYVNICSFLRRYLFFFTSVFVLFTSVFVLFYASIGSFLRQYWFFFTSVFVLFYVGTCSFLRQYLFFLHPYFVWIFLKLKLKYIRRQFQVLRLASVARLDQCQTSMMELFWEKN